MDLFVYIVIQEEVILSIAINKGKLKNNNQSGESEGSTTTTTTPLVQPVLLLLLLLLLLLSSQAPAAALSRLLSLLYPSLMPVMSVQVIVGFAASPLLPLFLYIQQVCHEPDADAAITSPALLITLLLPFRSGTTLQPLSDTETYHPPTNTSQTCPSRDTLLRIE